MRIEYDDTIQNKSAMIETYETTIRMKKNCSSTLSLGRVTYSITVSSYYKTTNHVLASHDITSSKPTTTLSMDVQC